MTKKYAMGIDIGGTNTAFGLVDEDGNVVAESKISTDKFNYTNTGRTNKKYKAGIPILQLQRLGRSKF